MQFDRSHWQVWASFLKKRGLSHLAAGLLEGTGPIALVTAQLLYAGRPLIGGVLPEAEWQALTEMLEDREECLSFVVFLREEEAA